MPPFAFSHSPRGENITACAMSSSHSLYVGTTTGQVERWAANTEDDLPMQAQIQLKRRAPVQQLVLVGESHLTTFVLAVCGGELFVMDPISLTPAVKPRGGGPAIEFKKDPQATVECICLNQRGPPDWGFCVLMSHQSVSSSSPNKPSSTSDGGGNEGGSLHLFMRFGSSQLYKQIKVIPLSPKILGEPKTVAWFETVLCVGGTRGCALIRDDAQTVEHIPIGIDPRRGPLILPLPEGRLLVTSAANGVGVIVDLQGQPVGSGAVEWPATPLALILSGSYVLALLDNGTCHIAHFQEPNSMVQVLPCPTGTCISSDSPLLGERIFLNDGTNSDVVNESETNEEKLKCVIGLKSGGMLILEALPLRDRVRQRLREDKGATSKALVLLRESLPVSVSPQQVARAETLFYVDAACVACELGKFDACFQSFEATGLSPSDVLLRVNFPPGFVFPSTKTNPSFAGALARYLWNARCQTQVLDDALVDALIDANEKDLLEEFMLSPNNLCTFDTTLARLTKLNMVFAAANLIGVRGVSPSNIQEACDQFKSPPDGAPHALKLLATSHKSTVRDFIFNADWLLRQDPGEFIQALLARRKMGGVDFTVSHEDAKFFVETVRVVAKTNNTARLIAWLSVGLELDDALERLVDGLEEDVAGNVADSERERLTNSFVALVAANITSVEQVMSALTLLDSSKNSKLFTKERVSAMQRLGRHRDAIITFVNEMGDFAAAEIYCTTVKMPSSNNESDVAAEGRTGDNLFAVLLAAHLTSPKSTVEAAIAFLSRHSTEMALADVIKALPESVPLASTMLFFERALPRIMNKRRGVAVQKNLARTENLHVKLDLVNAKKEAVVVSAHSICSRCGGKFTAGQTIQVLPGGGGVVGTTRGGDDDMTSSRAVAHILCPVTVSTRPARVQPVVMASPNKDNDDDVEWMRLR